MSTRMWKQYFVWKEVSLRPSAQCLTFIRLPDDILPSLLPNALLALPQTYCPRLNTPGGGTTSLQPTDGPPAYPVVALGGTFDHLHAGHKILLSMGAWIASEKLIVGVTGILNLRPPQKFST